MTLTAALAVLTGAVTVVPASVPAHGRQEALITVDKPEMVHFQTSGPTAPRCEFVDHLRGPFDTAGVAGKTHCNRDLLLDAGTYKVRLITPARGKGKITLSATAFSETNAPALQIEEGRTVEQAIRPREQASFWMHLPTNQSVTIRAAGRTAGEVELWRDGRWRVDMQPQRNDLLLGPGQPIHEEWIRTRLEAGDYRLTVYGASPKRWAKGAESDAVSVSFGFPPEAHQRSLSGVLSPTGYLAFTTPLGSNATVLSLASGLSTPTDLLVYSVGADGTLSTSPISTCRIEPRALQPECGVWASDSSRHVIMVRGAPGTRVDLQWIVAAANQADGSWIADHFQVTRDGGYVTGTYVLVADRDGAPTSCMLQVDRDRKGQWETIAQDFIEVDSNHAFQRSFNFADQQTIWFQVADAAQYAITTGGESPATCDLYRMPEQSSGSEDLERLSAAEGNGCHVSLTLTPGSYELHLYGTKKGIQTLRIGTSWSPTGETPTKTSCLLPPVSLSKSSSYRIRVSGGGESVRAQLVRPSPLSLGESVPLALDPGHPIQLPIAPGGPVEVRGHGAFQCKVGDAAQVDAKDGVCRLPGNIGASTLTVSASEPTNVAVMRGGAQPGEPPPLAPFSAKPVEPPKLALDKPQFYDFDREESRSLLFEVKDAGLYHVETQGLLATRCTLRSPVVASLAEDQGSGRGRNCLLEQYLRRGQYLVTVTTVGASRGRASVSLTQRAPRESAPVGAGEETFFAVQTGELVQQRVTIPKPPKLKKGTAEPEYELSTTARGGAGISCRLEDRDGWPVIPVPASCDQKRTFDPGEYLWMQLPLTVESIRHTKLERAQPPVVFSGKKVHAVVFNQWTDALLRKDGHDEYFINLRADADLTIALTNRMQGRLYLINPDKSLKPVDVIPPAGADSDVSPVDIPSDVAAEESEEAPPPEQAEAAEPEPEETDEEAPPPSEGEETSPETPTPPSPPPQVKPTRPPPLPPGHVVHLAAGPYKLITEHSQGDVHIHYRLFVGSDLLVPGFSRELQTPCMVTVRVPQNGTLRVKTSGESAVQCRLYDSTQRLVSESKPNGDDWNCALAEPTNAGDYTLLLEDETHKTGRTTVSVDMPAVQDVGMLINGASWTVDGNVLVGSVPAVSGDVAQEVSFTAPTPFSCAIEDAAGTILRQDLGVTSCGFLIHPGTIAYRIRLWTLAQNAQVKATVATYPVEPQEDGRPRAGTIARTVIAAPGRYSLAPTALCLSDAEQGVFRRCGSEVSLEAGRLLVGALGAPALDQKVTEIAVPDDFPQSGQTTISRQPVIQRQFSTGPTIHLLQVTTPPGEQAAPACVVEGGIRLLLPDSCVAVSRIAHDGLARWWAPSDTPVDAQIMRASLPPPTPVPLPMGRQTLQWSGASARYALPADSARLELILPENAWAVRIDKEGAAEDLCVATHGFQRCVMSTRGDELLLYSPREQRAQVTVVLASPLPPPIVLNDVYENVEAVPGSVVLNVPATSDAQTITCEGAAHCVTTLSDGTRVTGETVVSPPAIGASVLVTHDAGPLRVSVTTPRTARRIPFNVPLPAQQPAWIPWSNAVDLTGALVDRVFSVSQQAVLHVKADSGVCALVSGTTFLDTRGLGGTCEIDRLVEPGAYRVLVRPFAKVPLTGVVSWMTDGVTQLKEGVGQEDWIAPTEAKLYTFTTQSPGKVGFGLQVPAETLECEVLNAAQQVIGKGCQQYLQLDTGSYVLVVRAPPGSPPTRFKPVLAGLAGANREVPEEYLRDFFERIGESQ